MKKRLVLAAALALAVAAVAALSGTLTRSAGSDTGDVANVVLQKQLAYELGRATAPQWQQHVSSGVMYEVLGAAGVLAQRANQYHGPEPALPSVKGTQGCPNVFVGDGTPNNIRVNQDCSRRRQAEEAIVANPLDPTKVIAGQNDSRVGFNHCGYDWSRDGGTTWGDQIPPFFQFVQPDNHTADACSDPTAAYDALGNAYAGGIVFDVAAAANSIVVEKSNKGIDGAFWHTPDSTLSFQTYRDNPVGLVATTKNPNIFNDKELMTADSNAASPKANNVYMEWTRFNAATGEGVGVDSPIYFSQSTDGGKSWSKGIEISGSNATVCTDFSGESDPNACDQDQGGDPIVGSDGTIYVAFGNGNTPTAGINQHLIVSCPPLKDCSQKSSWTDPVFITDDIGTQPVGPNGTTGCPAGRQCLPPNGYRLDDFVEGSVSIDSQGTLYFTWADFKNGGPPCDTGDASTSTPPCNNDVFYAVSHDGGQTWSGRHNATPSTGTFGQTAQWQPWSTVDSSDRLQIAFYDRQYGNCEFDGCNDITLATVTNPTAGKIVYRRITTSSMPNLTPANNPLQAGFLGDYMWIAAGGGRLHIVWADTRGENDTVEEDVYTAHLGSP
jgi:hypothetical protein